MYTTQDLLELTRSGFLEIGYQEDLLLNGYTFADFFSPLCSVRAIHLAGFVQHPPSYKNSSFGVLISNGSHPKMEDFAALGAPHIFVMRPNDGEVSRWKMVAKKPERIENIKIVHFPEVIRKNGDKWGPESIFRAKCLGNYNRQEQLDFFDLGLLPVLEREVHIKLDKLFDSTLTLAINEHRKLKKRELDNKETRGLFRLVFRLVAAKLLADRNYPGEWLEQSVLSALYKINDFYFKETEVENIYLERDIQQLVWDEIRSGLHLQNLSLEALAYVYENTFVNSETRNMFDTHATPSEIAELIVKELPFEQISNQYERIVFEPFSGHAPFLTASLGRLRSLLPVGMSASERHKYFVNMLYGIELDSFASEIARYSLILADYPNADGWQITEGDVLKTPKFNEYLKKASIVLCNPPFANFSKDERSLYSNLRTANKALEAISRVLENPPQMMGFILPRIFTDGQSYKEVRRQLVRIYGSISMIALPDCAFRHSDAETVVVLASDRETNNKRHWKRIFISKKDYAGFWQSGQPTWQDHEFVYNAIIGDPQLWKHPLISNLKENFVNFETLKDISEIHRGIEYNSSIINHVSDIPKQGYKRGLQNLKDGFKSYVITGSKYLDLDPRDMRSQSYRLPWNQPKIVVNASRSSRGPWRLMAAIDRSGLVCYQRFHSIWIKNDFSLEIITAVLNGPVANVLLGASGNTRDNLIRDLYTIPLPKLTKEDIRWIKTLVNEYQKTTLSKPSISVEHIITQINTSILSGYNLPSKLEGQLLDYIGSIQQPKMSHSFIEQIHAMHGMLVDKQFLKGLTKREEIELKQINRILDASEEKYYAPVKKALILTQASILKDSIGD